MNRYIVLDTETTGLVVDSNRVFEIGCVEIINKIKTDRFFHTYLSSDVPISKESQEICKINPEILNGKPKFEEVVDKFLEILNKDKDGNDSKAIIVAHNVMFDVNFLNMELKKVNKETLNSFTLIDTVKLAKFRDPGKAANLDALCRKFNIDLSKRESLGHGALLDAELLAEIFLYLWGNDSEDFLTNYNKSDEDFVCFNKRSKIIKKRETITFSASELEFHNALLNKIKAKQDW